MMRHPRAFSTLSGPDMKKQIDELFQQGDLWNSGQYRWKNFFGSEELSLLTSVAI